jgi:arylsulfatase A-like enzyme
MARRNVLWIMCDQLRFDYLGCAGHPHLPTPNIDRLAQKGVRFTRAYVNSPICGPSRMSFYTGRYVRSHGSTWQGIPLRVGEPTLGHHLNEIGVRNVLVGKTHMTPDVEGMKRLGMDVDSFIGVREAQCGFEPFERDDGLVPKPNPDKPTNYNAYLNDKGYDGDNPWEEWANSGEGPEGDILSGWLLAHADKAARVDEPDSESPYMTDRAMQFIKQAKHDDRPWCLHLSYIKPHWPYIVPAPYNDMFGADDVLPAVRSPIEKNDPNPLFEAYMGERWSHAFSRDSVRNHVIPAYMGLIKQIDDQVGRMVSFLEKEGLDQDTMIVFTSDHGDYLGDHWLGEKELFHDQSVKIPLIVYDPDQRADATRGTTCDALVEAIDLAPTFIEYFGGTPPPHILEGRSLLGIIEGTPPSNWRCYVVSEYDYAMRRARIELNMPVADCRLVMVMSERWKYVYAQNLPPMLYDLQNDPDEFEDLGRHPDFADTRAQMHEVLTQWSLRFHTRITATDQDIEDAAGHDLADNILMGYWDEQEVETAKREAGLPSD